MSTIDSDSFENITYSVSDGDTFDAGSASFIYAAIASEDFLCGIQMRFIAVDRNGGRARVETRLNRVL